MSEVNVLSFLGGEVEQEKSGAVVEFDKFWKGLGEYTWPQGIPACPKYGSNVQKTLLSLAFHYFFLIIDLGTAFVLFFSHAA